MHVAMNFPQVSMAMKIELTDQQEQAVKQGRPVEVVDPTSDRAFVVVARESFEPVRGFFERSLKNGPAPSVSSAVAAPTTRSPAETKPLRVCLRDLPTPPELVEDIERIGKKRGCWKKKDQRELEEELKLQCDYGGRA